MFRFLILIMMISHPTQVYAKNFSKGIKPSKKRTITEWASSDRIMPEGTAVGAGQPIDLSLTPYVYEINQALDSGSGINEVVVMKGAQVAISTVAENFAGHNIAEDPNKFMYVMPTHEGARRISTEKISPMIADSPSLEDLVAPPSSKTKTNTTFEKQFPGGRLLLTGANSPKGLRQTSICKYVLDEYDAMGVTSEGRVLPIVRKRAVTFGRLRKEFILSTPLIKGLSQTEEEYENSDMCLFHIPCPHCGHEQPLDWEQFNLVVSDPHMKCRQCSGKIEESSKRIILSKGRWVPRKTFVEALEDFTNSEGKTFEKGQEYWIYLTELHSDCAKFKQLKKKRRGFQISTLYAPLGWYSWKDAVREYLAAKDDPESLKVFWNTVLGLPFEEAASPLKTQYLLDRRCDMFADDPNAQVPKSVLYLTGSADTQDDRIEILVSGWGLNKEGNGLDWHLIDHHIVYGDPDDPDVKKEVLDYCDSKFLREDGKELEMRAVGIDSAGHKTDAIYTIANSSRKIHAIIGRGNYGRRLTAKPSKMKTKRGRPVDLYTIGNFAAKKKVHDLLSPDYAGSSNLYLPKTEWCDREFCDQILAEKIMTRYNHGKPELFWFQTRKRNEALDLLGYAWATLHIHKNNPIAYAKMVKKLQEKSESTSTASTTKRKKQKSKPSSLLS